MHKISEPNNAHEIETLLFRSSQQILWASPFQKRSTFEVSSRGEDVVWLRRWLSLRLHRVHLPAPESLSSPGKHEFPGPTRR